MQKRKPSDSDNLPEQKKQRTEKGKFVEASVDVLKPDAYKVVTDSDICTNSLVALQGSTSSNHLSSSKIYEVELMDIDEDEPVEDNLKAKEDNGVTKCEDDTIHTNNGQMVLESSDISAEGNPKTLSSECREHPSPIRGVIHDSSSLNENCEESLIKSLENEGCFSLQSMDRSKAVDVSNNQSETLESKNDPNNVILNDEGGNRIDLDSIVESQLINISQNSGSDLVSQGMVSNNQYETLESENDPNDLILNIECGNSIGLESKVESQFINTSEKNGSDLVSQAKVSDSPSEIPESKNDPNNVILNHECGSPTGLESKVESQLINTFEKNGSVLATQAKVSDSQPETLEYKNDPNNVISNDVNSIGFESKVESELINTSEKIGSALVNQAKVSDSQSETLESKSDPNDVISYHECETSISFESKMEYQFMNTSEKNGSTLVSQDKVSDSQFETLEFKNDPINMTSKNEKGNSVGLGSKVESQWMNISERNGSQYVSKRKLSDTDIIKPGKSIVSKRRKLLVLDINGLLVDIFSDYHDVHRGRKKIGGKVVFKRPFCDDFIKFCFEKFDIGIWSSRRSYHVHNVIEYLMWRDSHELLFCWDQDHCTITGFNTLENEHKPLVLKEMTKLWNKEEKGFYEKALPWKMGYFSPSNTLLVDDSPYKALCNPPYTAIFPHPYTFDKENDNSLGPGGDLRVYLEGLCEADDVQTYVRQHPFGQPAITSEDPSWSFYSQVVQKVRGSNETQVASEWAG